MSLNLEPDPNVTTDTAALQMAPSPIYQTAPIDPAKIEQAKPEFPPDILPIRQLKVAGIAFGVPESMSQEAADTALLNINTAPEAPKMAIANMDEPPAPTAA